MDIRYFVAYVYQMELVTGHANSPVEWPHPIRAFADVELIEEQIRQETGFDHITITSWQRFEE
jgi:hypothetical protein